MLKGILAVLFRACATEIVSINKPPKKMKRTRSYRHAQFGYNGRAHLGKAWSVKRTAKTHGVPAHSVAEPEAT